MLTPRLRTLAQSLDLAFRRQKSTRAQLDDFELARQKLLADINPAESEEHLKGLLVAFLRQAAGQPTTLLETQIDTLVAARYGLTPAEAAQIAS